jgi:hypothetical protein
MRKRSAGRQDLGLSPAEFLTLRRLSTPEKIQRFLFDLKQNFEPDGDTCRTVRGVLRERRAHCIEGAMLAAAALWIQGEPPLLMDLRAEHDYDHVITLFRRRGCWGAISKTNGIGLRWRDPVYRTLRELAMSYLHEYANRRDRKTLREFSVPYDLRRMPAAVWASGEEDAWEVCDRLDEIRHYRLVTRAQTRLLVRRDPFERKVGNLLQYPRPRAILRKEAQRRKA